jgi:NAD(P)H-hydrate epimerase
MENASLKVVKNLELDKYNSFCIVCTKGNNGGDGFAVARHLYSLNKKVEVFLVGNRDNMSEDCRVNYEILKEIVSAVNIPLVLHGASGIGDEALKKCIEYGISKVNIFTDLMNAASNKAKEVIDNEVYGDVGLHTEEAIKDCMNNYLDILGCTNLKGSKKI